MSEDRELQPIELREAPRNRRIVVQPNVGEKYYITILSSSHQDDRDGGETVIDVGDTVYAHGIFRYENERTVTTASLGLTKERSGAQSALAYPDIRVEGS